MMPQVLLLSVMTFGNPSIVKVGEENVDLIELNHFYDQTAKHVYDQVIIYEWIESQGCFRVRAWFLVENDGSLERIPRFRRSNQRWEMRWRDKETDLQRQISSRHFRESWSQIDPEQIDRKKVGERYRTALIRFPKPTLPADALVRR